MITTKESLCPQCAEKNKKNLIISVFYKCNEALYTCEDKTCTYFVTNIEGNLVKYNKESNTTSYVLDQTSKPKTLDEELSSFFDSFENNYDKGTDVNYSLAQDIVQVPVNQSCESNSVTQNYHIESDAPATTKNINEGEIFKMDGSTLNFDDLFV